MNGYTKLFGSIVGSSIWSEDDQTRIVWITMLAIANADGEVEASPIGLARLSGVNVEAVEKALERFQQPDRYSRTKAHDGRRIAECDGGWRLLNYDLYREKMDIDDRRRKAAERQRRKRERDASRNVTPCHAPSRDVTESHDKKTRQDKTRRDKKRFSPPVEEDVVAYATDIGMDGEEARAMFDFYESKGWKVGSATMKCWKAAARGWHRRSQDKARPERRESREAIKLEGGLV